MGVTNDSHNQPLTEAKSKDYPCPLNLPSVHCNSCAFAKEGICDWPHHEDLTISKLYARLLLETGKGESQ
jgi:hypothetical protein